MPQKKPPLQDVIVRTTPKRERPAAAPAAQQEAFRVLKDDTQYETQREARGGGYGGYNATEEHEHYTPERDMRTPSDFPRGRETVARHPMASWAGVAIVVGLVVVLGAFLFSALFAGATVSVYPRQDTVVVNATVLSEKDGGNSEVPFFMYDVSATAQQVVEASEKQEVEERATGTITIYNAFSDAPQRLIKNTRFENTDGRIYRIRQSVEVPGMQNDTPGKIDAVVFAEEPGEAYNISGTATFSVPGFAGMPQEGKVYAESAGAIAGGFIGEKRVVEESDRMRTLSELESTLRADLRAKLAQDDTLPEGGVYFDGGMFYQFSPLPDEDRSGEEITLSLSGTLHAVVFDKEALAAEIARGAVSGYDGSPIVIEDTEGITIELQPAATSAMEEEDVNTDGPVWDAKAYMVQVRGKAPFVWLYDAEQLARDIAGKDKHTLAAGGNNTVLDAYPGIDRIEVQLRPFWKNTLPQDQKDIRIETKLD